MITSNLSITTLVLNQDIKININETQSIIVKPFSVKQLMTNADFTILMNICNYIYINQLKKFLKVDKTIDLINILMYDPRITNTKEFSFISNALSRILIKILPQLDPKNRKMYVNNIEITELIWEWISYVICTIAGDKIEEPFNNDNDEVGRQLYEKEMAAKAKIQQIKNADKNTSSTSIVDIFHLIMYKFPSYSIETLLNKTMYEISYLRNYTMSIITYENAMSAYTTGNLKKAPDFFLK